MIKLKRPPAPAVLLKSAPPATAQLWEDWRQKKELTFNARIYGSKKVKQSLLQAQHRKCAYCETRLVRDYGQVEHCRPKAGWKQKRSDRLKVPGYFWLAYEWSNLCVSCAMCNDAGHKGNLFPLANPHRRATPAKPSHAAERPLLLDAFVDDPETNIGWQESIPVPVNECPRAAHTISTFRLDEDEALVDERRAHLKRLKAILNEASRANTPSVTRKALITLMHEACLPEAPYSSMSRALLGPQLVAIKD